jgi:hypothetical protein
MIFRVKWVVKTDRDDFSSRITVVKTDRDDFLESNYQ